MKSIWAVFIFISIVSVAHADWVIQQKIESMEQNGVIVLKIKGDQLRMDMPTARAGDVSVIQDMKTCDKVMMIHQQKLAKVVSGDEVKQKAQLDNGNQSSKVPVPVDTGKSERIGNYDTEIYSWTNNHGSGGTLWVARNYPNRDKIKNVLKKLYQSPFGQLTKTLQPDSSVLPGIVVKSKKNTAFGEVTLTLVSVEEKSLPDSDFQTPSDYRVIGLKITPGKSGQ